MLPGHVTLAMDTQHMTGEQKMKKILVLMMLAGITLFCAQTTFAAEPGVTGTVFNKRFLPGIKPLMTYAQVVALAGAPGVKIDETAKTGPPTVRYRWKGGKRSILTARFSDNRLLDATVLVPNGRTFIIKKDGSTQDLGYQK